VSVKGVGFVTSVVGLVEEQQETIGCVNRNSDSDSDSECDACGGAISGVEGVEDYLCHVHVNRHELLF
jgi:hypothetical protein